VETLAREALSNQLKLDCLEEVKVVTRYPSLEVVDWHYFVFF
jgi:hypothetical protein